MKTLCRQLALGVFILFALLETMAFAQRPTMGAERMEILLPLLRGRRVALMVNQTSLVGESQTHLLDTLLSRGITVSKVFVPEHGFRGDVDAGKYVRDGKDRKTGVPIVSLYGKTKKPTPAMLSDVDILLFDVQDVGARFYTYISSMYYLMQASYEHKKPIVVCDRPNPNDYVDGPVLEDDCKSFVGLVPVPIMHGLTVGELAQMINAEGWLTEGGQGKCPLEVIPMLGWKHGQGYELPVRPSPNLATTQAIALYPSLCFFEATDISVGRGTDAPFTQLGYPNKHYGKHSFIPTPKIGADAAPMHQGKRCYGVDLSGVAPPQGKLSLEWLIHFSRITKAQGRKLITKRRLFELLAGNKRLARQIEQGMSEEAIRATWALELERYKLQRRRYLLYEDNVER